jgi:multiple sugar transport system permease protein
LYFLPTVTPIVAFALVWDWLLSPNFGLLNYFLTRLGRETVYFLGSETTALATVVLVTIWASVGYYSLVIAAGLARIPRELEEAALLDGAGPLRRFIKIILPQLGPTLLFLCVIGVITSFQVFDSVFVMTHPRGGPNYATTTLVLHLYNTAFGGYDLKMGYACAIAWAIFACIFISVWLQLQWSRRTVHYE